MTGSTVSHYRIIEELGRGGMGVVYRAIDTKLDRTVALKFLPKELSFDTPTKRRFIQEAKAASSLDHANIGVVHEIGETEDGRCFIAMACYEGETLRQRISRGPLPITEAIDYAFQIASALKCAHEKGIVHRDVKPSNVIVTDGGVVKLLDFGLAKVADVHLTKTGETVGTVAYMSPEQASGEQVDHRTDIWSLGVVLYEMLSGVRPFEATWTDAVLYRIRHDEPKPITSHGKMVPAALANVVQKMLMKSPQERYHSVASLAEDLAAIRQQLDGSKTTTTSTRFRKHSLALAAAGVLLAAAAVLFIVSGDGSGSGIRSLAVLPPDNLSGNPDQEYFVAGMHEALIGELAQIGALRVISRTSSMQFENSRRSVPDIAQELGVEALLEASVLSVGDSVRIQAQLIQAAPREQHLGTWTFDRHARDVLAIHSEVAQSIAEQIDVTLTGSEQARLARARVVNPEAHALYLKGNFELSRQTERAFRQAIRYFEEAISRDSLYAPAFAGLAATYTALGSWMASEPPRDVYADARDAALKAIELDSTLAEGYMALGRIKHLFEWDWAGADSAFRRGIALNPSATMALFAYGNYLASMGRSEEAAEVYRQAIDRDPLFASAYWGLGWEIEKLGKGQEALQLCQRSLDLGDEFGGHFFLSQYHLKRNRFQEAVRHARLAEAALTASGSPTWQALIGHHYARAGRTADARRILDHLQAWAHNSYVPPNALAVIYLGLGQEEKALDFLERGYEIRDVTSVWHKVRWIYDPIRDEPRFQRIVELMDFPDA